MPPQPRAILFDMDGTILDWQTGMEESWLAACEAHDEGSFQPARLHETIRARRTWFWDDGERARTGRLDLDEACRTIVRHAFADLGLASVGLAEAIADDYRVRRAAHLAPYPGALETLAAVRAQGISTALLTNGGAESQRRSVDQHDLKRFFDCIVIEGEFGLGKPDERVFRHALAALSCEPAEAWMIGDSLEADIAPARDLGMHAIWVDGAGAGLPPDTPVRPHRIVRGISELAPAFETVS